MYNTSNMKIKNELVRTELAGSVEVDESDEIDDLADLYQADLTKFKPPEFPKLGTEKSKRGGKMSARLATRYSDGEGLTDGELYELRAILIQYLEMYDTYRRDVNRFRLVEYSKWLAIFGIPLLCTLINILSQASTTETVGGAAVISAVMVIIGLLCPKPHYQPDSIFIFNTEPHRDEPVVINRKHLRADQQKLHNQYIKVRAALDVLSLDLTVGDTDLPELRDLAYFLHKKAEEIAFQKKSGRMSLPR
jgi:hypothetical protein